MNRQSLTPEICRSPWGTEEILRCYHSDESYWGALSFGDIHFSSFVSGEFDKICLLLGGNVIK